MRIAFISGISTCFPVRRGTMRVAPLRFSAHHERSYVKNRGAAVEDEPNLNLIERLWKFLRKKALSRWQVTFEGMQAAVAEVLERLGDYRDELATLMTERFSIVEVETAAA